MTEESSMPLLVLSPTTFIFKSMQPGKIYFFTATILNWIPILHDDAIKEVKLDSLKYLIRNDAIKLYAYVIMPNHIHLIIKPLINPKFSNVQLSFMKFTAQQIKFYLQEKNTSELEKFLVNKKDRRYQIWQRNPLTVELYSRFVIEQKLDYIHNNPVSGKWDLASSNLDYKYSSITFYENDEQLLPFLTHYMNEI